MEETHDAKSHDYAKIENRYSNFEFAAAIADEFPDGPDRVFATMLGIKLARLAELLSQGKDPKHESVEDTFLDLSNYAVKEVTPAKKHTLATGIASMIFTDPLSEKKDLNLWGV